MNAKRVKIFLFVLSACGFAIPAMALVSFFTLFPLWAFVVLVFKMAVGCALTMLCIAAVTSIAAAIHPKTL